MLAIQPGMGQPEELISPTPFVRLPWFSYFPGVVLGYKIKIYLTELQVYVG